MRELRQFANESIQMRCRAARKKQRNVGDCTNPREADAVRPRPVRAHVVARVKRARRSSVRPTNRSIEISDPTSTKCLALVQVFVADQERARKEETGCRHHMWGLVSGENHTVG